MRRALFLATAALGGVAVEGYASSSLVQDATNPMCACGEFEKITPRDELRTLGTGDLQRQIDTLKGDVKHLRATKDSTQQNWEKRGKQAKDRFQLLRKQFERARDFHAKKTTELGEKTAGSRSAVKDLELEMNNLDVEIRKLTGDWGREMALARTKAVKAGKCDCPKGQDELVFAHLALISSAAAVTTCPTSCLALAAVRSSVAEQEVAVAEPDHKRIREVEQLQGDRNEVLKETTSLEREGALEVDKWTRRLSALKGRMEKIENDNAGGLRLRKTMATGAATQRAVLDPAVESKKEQVDSLKTQLEQLKQTVSKLDVELATCKC